MREFRVVTHKTWLADQFAPMGAVHDWGFDIDPVTAPETLWWAPGAWVASALKAGVTLPLLSPGAYWMQQLPMDWKGRKIRNVPLSHAAMNAVNWWGEQVFVKLPEAKLENFPARLHTTKYLHDNLAQYRLPRDTIVQIQEPVNFHTEARFWIAHQEIVAASYYRFGEFIWGCEDWDDFCDIMPPVMKSDIAELAAEVARIMDAPPGYVLDCGRTHDAEVFVVETNAAWSSGPYDGDPAGIFEAIKASHDFDGEHPAWAWNPNPVLYSAGPLKVMTR